MSAILSSISRETALDAFVNGAMAWLFVGGCCWVLMYCLGTIERGSNDWRSRSGRRASNVAVVLASLMVIVVWPIPAVLYVNRALRRRAP